MKHGKKGLKIKKNLKGFSLYERFEVKLKCAVVAVFNQRAKYKYECASTVQLMKSYDLKMRSV